MTATPVRAQRREVWRSMCNPNVHRLLHKLNRQIAYFRAETKCAPRLWEQLRRKDSGDEQCLRAGLYYQKVSLSRACNYLLECHSVFVRLFSRERIVIPFDRDRNDFVPPLPINEINSARRRRLARARSVPAARPTLSLLTT